MCKKILTAGLAVLMVLFASCSADMFSKVDDVSVLSVIPDDDFSQTGVLTLSLIPLDKDGDVIVSNSISLKADYVQDGDIVELDVSKPDVKKPEKNALPWAFAIDIDASGSMSSSDPKKIRIESSKLFVDSILTSSPSSKIAVATFGDGTSNSFIATKLLQDFTSNKNLLDDAIDTVPASSGTPLWDSAYEFAVYLNDNAQSSAYSRELLLLSDGGDNGSYDYSEEDLKRYATTQDIPVHIVALGYNSSELQDIALETGGIYIYATDASSLKDSFTNLSTANIDGYIMYTITFPEDSIPPRYSTVLLQLSVKNALSGEKNITTKFTVY